MTLEEKMLMQCSIFEQEFKMNKLGIFLLDKKEITDLEISMYEKSQCFGMVEDDIWLSRGRGYYHLGITPQIIKQIQNNLEFVINRKSKSLIFALNEFLLNHFAVFWYDLHYNQKEKDVDMACRLFSQMKEMVGSMLNALFDKFEYINLDWEFLIYIVDNVHINDIDFRIPECDNKIDIVKEICWILHSNVLDEVDVIMFPMYGSFQLMLFTTTILQYNCINKKCYPINIGFHDQVEQKKQIITENGFHDKRVLVIDDNIGTGNTMKWCKQWIREQGGDCITRVCEIPWDIFCRINKYDVIRENIDMPSIKNNFRLLSKSIFIQGIKIGDYSKIYRTEHLYNKEDMNFMYKRILQLKESKQLLGVQLENMFNEFYFYNDTLRMGENV